VFSSSADNDTGKNVTNFIFISRKIANNAWKLNNKLIFGASFIYPDGRIFCNKLSKIKTYYIKEGFCIQYKHIDYDTQEEEYTMCCKADID